MASMFVLENLNAEVDHPGVPFGRAATARAGRRRSTSPHLRLMLDLYHAQIGEGNLIELLRRAAPYIGEIQVADVPGPLRARYGRDQLSCRRTGARRDRLPRHDRARSVGLRRRRAGAGPLPRRLHCGNTLMLKFAVLGCGRIGRMHARNIAAHPARRAGRGLRRRGSGGCGVGRSELGARVGRLGRRGAGRPAGRRGPDRLLDRHPCRPAHARRQGRQGGAVREADRPRHRQGRCLLGRDRQARSRWS